MKFARIRSGWLGVAGCLLVLSAVNAQEKTDNPAKPSEFKTVNEKVSYGIGMNFGANIANSLKSQGVDADLSALLKGISDAYEGKDSRLSDDEMQAALEEFTKTAKERQARAKKFRDEQAKKQVLANPELKAESDKNIAAGEAFLKANKAKDAVKTTASGLQYQVLKEGTGKKPKETDVVSTHYHGTLPDGTVFDSSVDRKQPASFRVDQVIDGWTEALQMMPVGSKWRLVIPSNLAYGWSGSGRSIGPNQVLVFEVELLKIVSDDEPAP